MQPIVDAPSTHWSQSNAITQDTLHLSSHLPAQVSRCRAYIESLETKLAGQQEYVSGLEGRLQADLARVAPLLGQGLDDLSAAQLSSLVRVHEDGARRARAMLVSHKNDHFVCRCWPAHMHLLMTDQGRAALGLT